MDTQYAVMEMFYSIQGEGRYQGQAAYFIRLAGCDVGCVWCDVKESWDKNAHAVLTVDEMVQQVQLSNTEIIIITGGEPLQQDCRAITEALKEKGYRVHVETSGAYPLTGTWDWICVSPKKFKPPLAEVLHKANELKVVVFNNSDFLWADQHAEGVTTSCELYLQPEWSKEKTMLPQILEKIQVTPKWKLSLQIHKYLGVR